MIYSQNNPLQCIWMLGGSGARSSRHQYLDADADPVDILLQL